MSSGLTEAWQQSQGRSIHPCMGGCWCNPRCTHQRTHTAAVSALYLERKRGTRREYFGRHRQSCRPDPWPHVYSSRHTFLLQWRRRCRVLVPAPLRLIVDGTWRVRCMQQWRLFMVWYRYDIQIKGTITNNTLTQHRTNDQLFTSSARRDQWSLLATPYQ